MSGSIPERGQGKLTSDLGSYARGHAGLKTVCDFGADSNDGANNPDLRQYFKGKRR